MALLDDDELARARRFHRPADAHRFATGRLALREALTERFADVPPRQWRYRRTGNGRPELASDACRAHFSLSRTDDLVAVAISDGAPCGVDVETVSRATDVEALELVLSEEERGALLATESRAHRTELALRSFTVKEAYGKALGRGLDYPLERVTVRGDGDHVMLVGAVRDFWSILVRHVSEDERLALVIPGSRPASIPMRWQCGTAA